MHKNDINQPLPINGNIPIEAYKGKSEELK